MRKLSDIKGEDALDVIAEIMEPAVEIFSDEKVEEAYKKGRKVDVAKVVIKRHKKAILKVLAILDEADPKKYAPSLVEIPAKLIEVLNDPAFALLFQSQGQSKDEASSGSATENTEATDKA